MWMQKYEKTSEMQRKSPFFSVMLQMKKCGVGILEKTFLRTRSLTFLIQNVNVFDSKR